MGSRPFLKHGGRLYSMYVRDFQVPDGVDHMQGVPGDYLFGFRLEDVRSACNISQFGRLCLDLSFSEGCPRMGATERGVSEAAKWAVVAETLETYVKATLGLHDYTFKSGLIDIEHVGRVLQVEPGKHADGTPVCDMKDKGVMKNKLVSITLAVDGVWVDPQAKTYKVRWRYIDVEVKGAAYSNRANITTEMFDSFAIL
jgi:hypothetical protein